MIKIGDASFRAMCEMWGVDQAIIAANNMGLKPTQKQIEIERAREAEVFKRANDAVKSIMEEDHHAD